MTTSGLLNLAPGAPPTAIHAGIPACRAGAYGAASALLGSLLSGPLAMLVIAATHPQPPWQGAESFARSYHPIQTLPYLFGFLLVGGLVTLVAALHALARDEQKPRTTVALVLSAVFASFVFLNYVVQTTFLPELARDYAEANAPIVAMLSMSHPKSLAWGVEMWGYGFIGVATWLAAPVFGSGRLERAAALAFAANGPVSILGALWTAARPGWVMTPVGLAAFGMWNVLLVAMAGLALVALRRGARVALHEVEGRTHERSQRCAG